MKKLILLLTFLIGLFIIGGCQSNHVNEPKPTSTSKDVSQITVTIKVINGDNMINSKKVVYQPDGNLLNLLKNNFDIKEEDGFITSINNYSQNKSENKYWIFTINGKMGNKEASKTKLRNNDEVIFKLDTLN